MRTVLLFAATVAVVAPASAQTVVAIAVEGGVSRQLDRRLEGCDACTPLAREFGGEVALFRTDSLAMFVGVRARFLGIDVSSDDTRLELDTDERHVSSGLRYYGRPGRARFFGEVGAGISQVSSRFTSASGHRRRIVAAGGFGLNVAPGAGVDIAVNDRTAVRLSGRWHIVKFAGEAVQQNIGGGAGLVFNLWRR